MKLLTATRYWATRRFVVSTIKLKPTKKKIVGGNISSHSCRIQAPIRCATPTGFFTEASIPAGRSKETGWVRMRSLPNDGIYWLAGIVTTGAEPFTPVSETENKHDDP